MEENRIICSHCGAEIGEDEDFETVNGQVVCSDCIERYTSTCDRCGASVREPDVVTSENHGVYTVKVTFRAAPEMLPNPSKKKYTATNVVVPDINMDSKVDMIDVSMILAAYAALSADPPKDTGLTPKQLRAADANMDGKIDSTDASMVSDFYGKLSQEDSPYNGMTLAAAWAAYLNDYFKTGGEIY